MQTLVIPAKAGIHYGAGARNGADYYLVRPPWIPAFAGMAKYCRKVVVFHGAELFGAPIVIPRAARLFRGEAAEGASRAGFSARVGAA